MFMIVKEFSFSASHELSHLPAGHKCQRLHGHNYVVRVFLSAEELDANGFVVDYGDLQPFKRLLESTFDHQHLNDVLGSPKATTAENLALYFYTWCASRWPQTMKVGVSETPKTWAYFEPGSPA